MVPVFGDVNLGQRKQCVTMEELELVIFQGKGKEYNLSLHTPRTSLQ